MDPLTWGTAALALAVGHAALGLPVVAIDAGHGGAQEGAVGACGLREKDVTLALAQEVAAILGASGRARAALTRDGDETVSLAERLARARRMGAELLLSIHANASLVRQFRGIETFFLAGRPNPSRGLRALVSRENDGVGLPPAGARDASLAAVLRGLEADYAHRESQALARRVQASLHAALGRGGRGVLQAPFWLLAHAPMAAALVEVGFVSHPEECRALGRQAHREAIAGALAQAILTHLSDPALTAQAY